MRKGIIISSVMVLSFGLFLAQVPAAEKTEAAFYRGKTVAIRTQSPGGSTDMITRVLTPFFEKELGAKIVIIPSRGNIQQTNTLFSAKPDGLSLGLMDGPVVRLPEFFEEPGIRYEAAKFEWIATFGAMPNIFFVSPLKPYRSIADLQKAKGLKFVTATPGGNYDTYSMLIIDVLGLDAKVTTGLGAGEIILMLQKGEADAGTVTDVATAPHVQKAKVIPLFSAGGKSKIKILADLPALGELVNMTERQKLIEVVAGVNKIVIAPPGTPMDRVNFLREVFEKIVKNEKATAAMRKLGVVNWNYVSGEEAVKILLEEQKQAQQIKKDLKAYIQKYRAVF